MGTKRKHKSKIEDRKSNKKYLYSLGWEGDGNGNDSTRLERGGAACFITW